MVNLVLSTPNFNSFYAKILGPHWFYHIPTQHINYFKPEFFLQNLQKIGFRDLTIHTSGRSLFKERLNSHNQIDESKSQNEQWVQSLKVRGEIETKKAEKLASKNFMTKIIDKPFYHFSSWIGKLGMGDQMRVYATKN